MFTENMFNQNLREYFKFLIDDFHFEFINYEYDRDISFTYYYSEKSNITICLTHSSLILIDCHIIKGKNLKFWWPLMKESELEDSYSIEDYCEYITNNIIKKSNFTRYNRVIEGIIVSDLIIDFQDNYLEFQKVLTDKYQLLLNENGSLSNDKYEIEYNLYLINFKLNQEILTNYLSDVLLGVKWWNPKDEINANNPKPNFLQKIGKFIFQETTPNRQ